MVSKVRVYGKAQNRTVLGIINAYLVMYPHATLSDLQQAFPDSLNPDLGVKGIFAKAEDSQMANFKGYFNAPDEQLKLGDGTKAVLATVWTKRCFDMIVDHARQYGIEIAEFTEADKGAKKGGFRLEYLNGYVPPVPQENKKKPVWIWIILAAIVLGILAFFLFRPKVVEKPVVVEKIVTVVDTVFINQKLDEIEKNFNAASFEQGKYELNDDAKVVLEKLAQLMTENSNLKLKIEGHTSAEGDPTFNQKLSEDRAKAAVDFLVSKGIQVERLTYEGKGSSEPIDPNDSSVNRRTEFIVIE